MQLLTWCVEQLLGVQLVCTTSLLICGLEKMTVVDVRDVERSRGWQKIAFDGGLWDDCLPGFGRLIDLDGAGYKTHKQVLPCIISVETQTTVQIETTLPLHFQFQHKVL